MSFNLWDNLVPIPVSFLKKMKTTTIPIENSKLNTPLILNSEFRYVLRTDTPLYLHLQDQKCRFSLKKNVFR